MSDRNSFEDRRRVLEESFFQKQNEELARKLRDEQASKEAKKAMAALSGVNDDALLDELIAAGVGPESLAALTLYPLVAVAWADGKLDPSEKQAVLRAAQQQGIVEGSASQALLDSWLATKPAAQLLQVWRDYVQALKTVLKPEQFAEIEARVLARSTDVAQAAGGILGLGALSREEKDVIATLKQAFSG